MTRERLRLLAVDDEEPALEDLVRMLEGLPSVGAVHSASSADEAPATEATRGLAESMRTRSSSAGRSSSTASSRNPLTPAAPPRGTSAGS